MLSPASSHQATSSRVSVSALSEATIDVDRVVAVGLGNGLARGDHIGQLRIAPDLPGDRDRVLIRNRSASRSRPVR
jgi:hypothetical protein